MELELRAPEKGESVMYKVALSDFEKNLFRVLAIKWANQGAFFIVGYI